MKEGTRVMPVRGMADIVPPESALWARVESIARKIFSLYGFEEVRTPIVEPKDLFVRSVGEASAVVDKEMYSFIDRSGNELALRPEGTASVVRSFISSGMSSMDRLARYYYLGPMFRYERPQKGRQRQFHQMGVELLGAPTPEADAECIAMVPHLFEELGISEWELRINSLGCKRCRPDFQKEFLSFVTSKKDLLCTDCLRRMEKNPLRLLDCKEESCRRELRAAPLIGSFWCDECKKHFSSLKHILDVIGIKYVEDNSIVRGLDYYVRTAFEFVSSDLGSQDAILGGGRYDGLVNDLGGPDIPGVGWALGMERLVLLLNHFRKGIKKEDVVYFALLGEKALEGALKTIQRLRKDGVRVQWDYSMKSLKSQMKQADRVGAHTVVIIGDDELSKGHAIVRGMKDGSQHEVKIDELPMHFVDIET